MATLAIGDVQGCYDQLMRLLERAGFDERRDALWFVGDLVNRGPRSLETLRFVKGLGARAVTILGNHDLNLLAVAAGLRRPHRGDTNGAILAAPDDQRVVRFGIRHGKRWRARRESNPRPLASEANTLSSELRARTARILA